MIAGGPGSVASIVVVATNQRPCRYGQPDIPVRISGEEVSVEWLRRGAVEWRFFTFPDEMSPHE